MKINMEQSVSNKSQFCSWQSLVILTLASSGVFHGIQKLSLSFILVEMPFRCKDVPANQTENIAGENYCHTCTEWDFDEEYSPSSAVSEFKLVCGDKFCETLHTMCLNSSFISVTL